MKAHGTTTATMRGWHVADFPVRVAVALLAATALVACSGTTVPPPSTPPPVHVLVDHVAREVPAGTTFGELIETDGLHASTGRLLSVSGAVLDPTADPGRVALNGRSAKPTTLLASGDRIHVVNGVDEVEPTSRTVMNAGRRVGDPERTLDTYPSRRIIVRGKVSLEVASVSIRSIGKGHAPREVALSFDDGPWPRTTERILRILRRYHVHATFFMVGSEAERYPGLVRKVRAAGHEIGNHSWDHPETLEALHGPARASEMSKTSALLGRGTWSPTLFRPPGGWYDDEVVQEARRQGMRVVTWSVDPADWHSGMTPKQVAHSVLSDVQPGSIVLLHDGGGDAGHTIAALPRIIEGIRGRGLRLVTIPARPV